MANNPMHNPMKPRANKAKKDVKSLSYLHTLFQYLPEDTLVIDRNYGIVEANNAFLNTTQRKRKDTIGRRCYEINHGFKKPCDQFGVTCLLPRVFKTGKAHTSLHHHRRQPSGGRILTDLIVSPLKDKNGKVTHVITTARKVVAQPGIPESCEYPASSYPLLIERMNQGFGILDKSGCILYTNPKLIEMAGRSNDDLIGQPVSTFLNKNHQQLLINHLARRIKGENSPYKINWNTPDGRKIAVLVSPQPIFDTDGNFEGCFAVFTDISNIFQAQPYEAPSNNLLEIRLQKQSQALKNKDREIEELNIALKVLLKKRDEEKKEQQEKVILNVKELVFTYLDKLRQSGLNGKQMIFADIMASNLNDIVSPFLRGLHTNHIHLSPNETQVANLIRQGKTSKEIANLLNLSSRTIESYRSSIRKKLGIKNQKINLRTYLMSVE